MKSLLVAVFWPAWEWIRWPERRWLFSSYGAQLSIRDSVNCRRLIESPWYQARFGDRFALTSDQNTKGRFDNDRSGYRLSTSVGGAVTGEGGDRIVCDDPNNVNEVESDSVRKTVNDWFDVVMSTRVNDPKTDLPEPVASDLLLRRGERAIDHGTLPAREPHSLPVRSRSQSAPTLHDARLEEFLVVLSHRGQQFWPRHGAFLAVPGRLNDDHALHLSFLLSICSTWLNIALRNSAAEAPSSRERHPGFALPWQK
jgi:hypothetical protein